MKRAFALLLLIAFATHSLSAGISIVKSSGIALTGADGVEYVGTSGIALTGADGFLTYKSNGIALTGADGIALTGADGIALTGADGVTYTGPNGIAMTGADGIALTGADGIALTGADGITLTGADGTRYHADSIIIRRPSGIALTGADGIALTGADGIAMTGADGIRRIGSTGIALTGADGIALTGADGITLTGADGIALTGADTVTGFGKNGVLFEQSNPAGIALTGADGIALTGADNITITRPGGITLTGADGIALTGADDAVGLQSVDPELALKLNSATDDSNINAVLVFHRSVTDADITRLRDIGILGGTRMRVLPVVFVTATRDQLIAVSRLPSVRSLYGNRTLNFDVDPYFERTGISRIPNDRDLTAMNAGLAVTGRNVTVAVLDTGVNGQHADLAGKLVQNVRLVDTQSAPLGFAYPAPVENLTNSDIVDGHGTFVAGIIAGTGASSGGKYAGVAPGARLLGLGAGEVNLTHVLSGFDYLLDKGASYNVRVVNCSFSANTVFDFNDPVNVATKMLSDRGVNVVFSAGNAGPGNGTLNPYAAAPWVIGVGATEENGKIASYSSRGTFGSDLQHPSLVAPGTNVISLRSSAGATGVIGLAGADTQRLAAAELPYYTTASGTSFSAPQVAGAVALMLEANPDLTPAEIKDILSRTATPLPKYFYHEAGAGMMNAHAAVLESAFPDRRMGVFRSVNPKNGVQFITSTAQTFTHTIFPNLAVQGDIEIPSNTVQASVNIAWELSANDFGLKLFNSAGTPVGGSNYVNLPGLTGRREKVVLRLPTEGKLRSSVWHSGSVGTTQNVHGVVEITRVKYPVMTDLDSLSADAVAQAQASLLTNMMLPEGRRFRPDFAVSRSDLCETLVRAGLVPQYLAADPMFTDVRDLYTRNVVEGVYANPAGKLIYDASAGGKFNPHHSATRLAAAIAFVRASGLEEQAAATSLPTDVTDAYQIPIQWRGHVAVAIRKGFISLNGSNRFAPSDPLVRIQLARALNKLLSLS